MFTTRVSRTRSRALLVLSLVGFWLSAHAKSTGTLHGKVLDPLGATIPNAKVTLLQNGKEITITSTDQEGAFIFSTLDSGRYGLRAEATGFKIQDTPSVFLSPGATMDIDVSLQIGSLPQRVVVSATGAEVPESQVGASVSVIDHEQLDNLNPLSVHEALRTVPGVQVIQTAQRGGTTSVFVRGGDDDFNKVLVDGIPVNDIGGAFEFANLSTRAVDRVEVLRGPNSVLYGSDTLSSVINVTTRHGTSTIPEFSYSVDGGNFGTLGNAVSAAGAFHQFDYFSEFSRFDTRNSIPNSALHDGTYAGNFGWTPNGTTQVRFTFRHTAVALGDANAFASYGIPDDSSQKNQYLYWGVTVQNQTTAHWHNLLSFVSGDLRYQFVNPSPTGTTFDPFGSGPNYLGNTVTIRGANGFSSTGQAILDYAGIYPQTFDSSTTRRSVYGQSDYHLHPDLGVTAGFRYENGNGFTNSQGVIASTDRNNYSAFLEANGSVAHRLYTTAGVGFEENAVFGFAATPRISQAYYLRRPPTSGFFGESKLKLNFGKGIKEPSIFDQSSSLETLLSQLPRGPSLIAKYGISPVGPERSQSFDFGLDEGLWNNRARFGVTFFRENFYDVIAFVNASVLPVLGVPREITQSSGFFGATINSDSSRAFGAELQWEANVGYGLHVQGEYTYLDSVVTRSFTGSAIQPSYNPAFPQIPIGAFAPLVGARPFNRAPHSGSVVVGYEQNRFGLALTGYFVSRRDGSTFLTDGYFGSSMLLPNRNLLAGYQRIDLSGRYAASRHVTAYCSVTNLLSEHYQEKFGYPSLPLTFRTGLQFTLGGEGGWWK
jgi:vitamin B12 transporter